MKTTDMTLDQYQDHMDKLATKVGQVLNGERLEDGMSACAACIGFGMTQLDPKEHSKMRAHIGNIIDAIVAKVPPPKATQNNQADAELGANMAKINLVMGMLADGKITREECRQRLISECQVADHNLDMLLNAYDAKAVN
jgi:hypothetical protein